MHNKKKPRDIFNRSGSKMGTNSPPTQFLMQEGYGSAFYGFDVQRSSEQYRYDANVRISVYYRAKKRKKRTIQGTGQR